MFDKVTENVDVGSVDKLARILGAFDENLNFLARELGIVAFVDGVKIRLEGESQAVRIGGQVLNALAKMSENGEEVDKGRMAYCIELAKEGRAGEMATLESGVVAITARGKQIKCKTVGQKAYVDAIKKDTVVFGVGPAGTGKTYLAVCMAVSAFKSRQVEKIILTRPAVEAGEKLGFLPGDLHEKVDPYLRPLYDALQELLGLETYGKLMERGAIEVAPLAYMRGRTLSNAFIILDEAQNTTREQMKMFLTRMGEGSKMVVTGDVTQIDLDGKESGLVHATNVLDGVEGIAVCRLTAKDVVRHPLVMRIIRAYEKDAEKAEKKAERGKQASNEKGAKRRVKDAEGE
ncbi:MAG: PhoH family protein [Clostridia bacterium]|nr:PhoH family protein [Clostridia bacterium]